MLSKQRCLGRFWEWLCCAGIQIKTPLITQPKFASQYCLIFICMSRFDKGIMVLVSFSLQSSSLWTLYQSVPVWKRFGCLIPHLFSCPTKVSHHFFYVNLFVFSFLMVNARIKNMHFWFSSAKTTLADASFKSLSLIKSTTSTYLSSVLFVSSKNNEQAHVRGPLKMTIPL